LAYSSDSFLASSYLQVV